MEMEVSQKKESARKERHFKSSYSRTVGENTNNENGFRETEVKLNRRERNMIL
jgi:hypothetical protein